MSDDYVVWDIDQILEAYNNIPEWKDNVDVGFKCLFGFLESNGLLCCSVTDSSTGNVVKRVIMDSEITQEGKLLTHGPKSPVNRWLGSKGAQKNPPDMKMLEKALAEIRNIK